MVLFGLLFELFAVQYFVCSLLLLLPYLSIYFHSFELSAFELEESQEEMVVSFLYIGAGIGAVVGGWICDAAGKFN